MTTALVSRTSEHRPSRSKKCPQCGNEVEVFSNDLKVICDNCGFVIYNDIISCVQWCRYAKECVGEETYNKLVNKSQG